MIGPRLQISSCPHEHAHVVKHWMFLETPIYVAVCKEGGCKTSGSGKTMEEAIEDLRKGK